MDSRIFIPIVLIILISIVAVFRILVYLMSQGGEHERVSKEMR